MKAKTPKEDPATKSAREAEQRRADAAFVDNAQGLLDDETRRRIRRFGARGSAARVIGGVGGGSGSSGTGGGGAGGGGGGSFCPAPDVPVLLANADRNGPGDEVRADQVRAGLDYVWTRHERTLEWGAFKVLAADRHEGQPRARLVMLDGRSSIYARRHRMFSAATGWTDLIALPEGAPLIGTRPGQVAAVEPAETGPVIAFTVEDAASLITDGLQSHNAKMIGDGAQLTDTIGSAY